MNTYRSAFLGATILLMIPSGRILLTIALVSREIHDFRSLLYNGLIFGSFFLLLFVENMVICFEDQETGRCLRGTPNGDKNYNGKMYSEPFFVKKICR